MRNLLASIVPVSVVSAAMAAPHVRRVTGTVERVIHAQGPCGGGVAITHEQMREWEAKAQRLPLARTAFTVFTGDRYMGKPVMRFKTDRSARFAVLLPE